MNLSDYKNINFDLEINKLLLIFLVGLIVATVIVNVKRGVLINTVKKLLRYEATDEESAKTLDEIKYQTLLVRNELKNETRLRRLISIVGEKKLTYEEYIALTKDKKYKEEKTDFSSARLYISAEKIKEAKIIEASNSVTPFNTVLLCILYFIIFTCLIILMPDILNLINNILA